MTMKALFCRLNLFPTIDIKIEIRERNLMENLESFVGVARLSGSLSFGLQMLPWCSMKLLSMAGEYLST